MQSLANLRDPLVLLSNKGEWPFPVEENCRLLDITDELRSCEFQQGDHFSGLAGEDMEVPAPFCLVPLAIKLRHICSQYTRSKEARAFIEANVPLPADTIIMIWEFLTGGDEFIELCREQLAHAERLMDLIDEKYPNILQGSLNKSVVPRPRPGKDGVDDDFAFDVGGFFSFASESSTSPVVELYKEMIEERYGLIKIEIPERLRVS